MTDLILRYAAVEGLLARLYRGLDASDPDEVAACFTKDAVWHRVDGPKRGEGAIRSVATDRPADRKTTHIPSNLVLVDEAGAVVCRYYLTVYGETVGEPPRLICCFDCEDRIDVTPEGVRVTDKRTWMRMKFD